jgi:hypothetical protein
MKKSAGILFVLCAISSGVAFAQADTQIWGDVGYSLDFTRVREGREGAIPGETDGTGVDELERWLALQNAFISFNFRYANFIDFSSEFSLDLTKLDATSLPDLVRVISLKASPALWCDLTFGKQRLQWGTANIFPAIDKLESVSDPLGMRSFREGVTGLKAVFTPTDWFSASLLVLPEAQLRRTRFAGRLDLLFWDIDLGIGAVKYNYVKIDDITDAGLNSRAETTPHDRVALFLDAIRYFDNFGVYTEFEYRYSRDNEYALEDAGSTYISENGNDFFDVPVIRWTTGMSLTIGSGQGMINAEYLYNSEGFNKSEAEIFYTRFNTHLASNPADPRFLPVDFGRFGSFRKHYLAIGAMNINLIDDFSFSLLILCNLESLAFDFSPSITLTVNKSVFIKFKYDFYHQFTDLAANPSELSFMDYNQRLSISVTTSYSN